MLGALADDDDQFAFVVELDRLLRPQQRRAVRHQRGQHAEKDRLEFRDVVLLRAFLDVVEVIEAQADDLAGLGHRQRELQTGERNARGGIRLGDGGLELAHVTIGGAQVIAEIAGDAGIHGLDVDDIIALDHAQPHFVVCFETDDFH
jgi:hypothetical protein